MFRKEFAEVLSKMGTVPVKDLRPLLLEKDPKEVSELKLLNLKFFDDMKFAQQLAKNYQLPFIDINNAQVREKSIKLIRKRDAIKYRTVPVKKTEKCVTLAIYDPTITEFKGELQKVFQHPIDFILVNIAAWKKIFVRISESVDELLSTIQEIKSASSNDDDNLDQEKDVGQNIVVFVNKILAEAFLRKVSDIHMESYEKIFRIRFRVDGKLQEFDRPPQVFARSIISRIKILAQLDISEKRKPQDGRIKLSIGGSPIDYRVSTLPCLFGEKVVMRLLDQSNLQLDMTKLGLETKQMHSLKKGILKPYGMCLVTGPTGSGKTTTLYSALYELNKPDKNISTAEDPVEFNLEGINQVDVKKGSGLTFANAFKSFLRQDPDIIMVGEIRDLEVGEIAVEAALTGHLVLSTLHTNDAATTVSRLLNMGIEPFLVADSLNAVVAQRLCRKICVECKEIMSVPIDELVAYGIAPNSASKIKVYRGKGCDACNGTGYKGRVAIYEVMELTQAVRSIIIKDGTSESIKRQAIKDGMKTLRMAALTKVAQGLTTLEEAVLNSVADKF